MGPALPGTLGSASQQSLYRSTRVAGGAHAIIPPMKSTKPTKPRVQKTPYSECYEPATAMEMHLEPQGKEPLSKGIRKLP